MSGVTQILKAIEYGDTAASDDLLPLVYQELRKLAAAKLASEPSGQSIQPTLLVHEAYVRLVDVEHQQEWNSRGHFFGAAAEAMRRILIENARRRKTQKLDGERRRISLENIPLIGDDNRVDLLALDEALNRLQELWPDKAELVKLRFFAGFTIPEAAHAIGISHATAERYWTFARTWLYTQLNTAE